MQRYRAVAIDYDGTLTSNVRPLPEVLKAVLTYREAGGTAILCTGRILTELRLDFPDVQEHFDAIVGENGGVRWTPSSGERALAAPVDESLERALRAEGAALRRGSVLLATSGATADAAAREITRQGLDAQLVHNRAELMILPAGISKGTGLLEVLAELGISHHSTAGIGDAENDHALLQVCELGVAVANAVEALKRHADVVLSQPAGFGVIEFLQGPLVRGEVVVHPERWRLEIGATDDGRIVSVPGSDVDLLIAGPTGSGKSHLAGLLIERAAESGYTLCVIDPEGDHGDLDQLRGVLRLGAPGEPPQPDEIARLLRHRFTSVVIDLSLLGADEQREYWHALSPVLDALRKATGSPHWIILDEADRFLSGSSLGGVQRDTAAGGYCFITYHPDALVTHVLEEIDCVLALRGAECFARMPILDATGALPSPDPERTFTLERGLALIADREGVRTFRPAQRRTRHLRHWHKYLHGEISPALRFHFRDSTGPTGLSAGNLVEFHRGIRRASTAVLAHHLRNGDLSRWLQDVVQDDVIAEEARAVERWQQCESQPDLEVARRALLRMIETRYALFNSNQAEPVAPASGSAVGRRSSTQPV
jgi:hypothetical protein